MVAAQRGAASAPFSRVFAAIDEGPRTMRPVKIDQVVLLLPDDEMALRVEIATLVAFCKTVQDTIVRLATLHSVEAPVAVGIGVTLVPGAIPRLQLALQGERRPALLEPLVNELAALAPVSVRDEVPFQIERTVHPHPRSN